MTLPGSSTTSTTYCLSTKYEGSSLVLLHTIKTTLLASFHAPAGFSLRVATVDTATSWRYKSCGIPCSTRSTMRSSLSLSVRRYMIVLTVVIDMRPGQSVVVNRRRQVSGERVRCLYQVVSSCNVPGSLNIECIATPASWMR